MIRVDVPITTDTGGDATVDTVPLRGHIDSILVAVGTLAATVDVTIVDKDTGENIDTFTNVTTNTQRFPRAEAPAASGSYDRRAIAGPVTITVAQGGSEKTGTVSIFVDGTKESALGSRTLTTPTRTEYEDTSRHLDPVTT